MKTLLTSLLLAFAVLSCGEPTDRPEDCNPNEFFDEARSLCRSCPAVALPQCDDGCGFEISANERGCPAASCILGETCSSCGETEFFSASSLQCEACDGPTSCADDSAPMRYVEREQCSLQCP